MGNEERDKRIAKATAVMEGLWRAGGNGQEVPIYKPKPVRLPQLTNGMKLVALQRKWHLVYPNDGMPGDLETLRRLVPSGLSKQETNQFIRGSLGEAQVAFLKILNTSWTKADLNASLAEAGLAKGLKGFDRETERSLQEVIRFKTD